MIRKAVMMSEKVLGVEHSNTLQRVWKLGLALYLRDRGEEAYDLCQNAHKGLVKNLGEKNSRILLLIKALKSNG